MPTACDLAGIDVDTPSPIQGISYLPTLTGRGEQRTHDFLYWEFHEAGTHRALRQGDWKIVQYDLQNSAKTMLFNIANDPGEQDDLAEKEPQRVAAMAKRMSDHRRPSPIFPNKALDAVAE